MAANAAMDAKPVQVGTHPNPGKSTKYHESLMRKWLMHCVLPARQWREA